MEDQKENVAEAQSGADKPTGAPTPAKAKAPREFSTIAFPYVHLEDAEAGARAIFSNAGTAEIALAQAASAMNSSTSSSGFRGDIAAMKLFGLLDGEQGRVRLTDLGRAIAQDATAEAARVEAFERIPLYQRVKASHNGKTLPKAQALETEFVELGVARKQAERARQIFERSAKHAGYIKSGSDRFVEPIVAARVTGKPLEGNDQAENEDAEKGRRGSKGGNGGGGGETYHPFIEGLLRTLPEPQAIWTVEDRAKWLQTAASIFSLIYEGDGVIEVKVLTKVSASVSQQPT